MRKVSFGKLVRGILATGQASPLQWQPEGGIYPRLNEFGAGGLGGRGGLYAVWHLGVRPQWLRVGITADLGAAAMQLKQAPWVKAHEGNAGIYIAWASPVPAQGSGFARFLAETLKPAFQHVAFSADQALDAETSAISCPLPPGTQT